MTNTQIWVGYALIGIAVGAQSMWMNRKTFQRDMRLGLFPEHVWPPLLFFIFLARAITWPYQLFFMLKDDR